MKVLVACEFSGVVRDAFIAEGHDAISCDLLPTESPGPHIQGDVTPLLMERWDLVISFPPCTYLTKAGVRWLHSNQARWTAMEEAARFFVLCLEANAARVAVENPVMHRWAMQLVGGGPTQYVQPYHYGHAASKRTGLWLKGLPPLMATEVVSDMRHSAKLVERAAPGLRWRKRNKDAHEASKTFPGIATAMARQWSAI